MKYFLFTLLSIFSLQAQTTILGKIVDAETQEPISFVNIYSLATHQGTYSNDDGIFRFEGLDASVGKVVISSMGYKTVEMPVATFVKNEILTIALEPESYIM